MAKKRPTRRQAVVRYPSHWFSPEDFLAFIELSPFSRRWESLELDEGELGRLQVAIMLDPKGASVIEGTGGLRKVRFSPSGWSAGKSSALRVIYKYCEEVGTVVLGIVYRKGEKDELDEKEKAVLRKAVERVERLLMSRPYRRRVSQSPGEQ
jgi:hypothetical protein